METALLDLVLDVAAILFAQITQHLGEYPLQRVVAHLAATGAIGVLDRLVSVVADVEGSAVEVAGILRGISVAPTELRHILLRTEHAGNDDLMQGHALDIETVEECLADVLQQHGGTGHEVGNARIERIDVVIGIRTNIDQFAFARLGILTVLHGRDAPAVGGGELETIGVGEGHGVVGDGTNLMIFTIYGFLGRAKRFASPIYDFGLRQNILTPHASLHSPRRSDLWESPSDTRKEQNDGHKS